MSDPTKRRGDDWWRHVILWVAVAVAVFPPLYVITAAFNADQTLSGTTFLPRSFTLENFKGLFVQKEGGAEVFFLRWFRASIVIAVLNAFFTVFIGALSAYAFSRFRFRGRRMGMLFLLLIAGIDTTWSGIGFSLMWCSFVAGPPKLAAFTFTIFRSSREAKMAIS